MQVADLGRTDQKIRLFTAPRRVVAAPERWNAPSSQATRDTTDADAAQPSATPGVEFHPIVYRSLLISVVVFIAASWLAFGHDGETDYILLIVNLVFAAFVGIPALIFMAGRKARRTGEAKEHASIDRFLAGRVDTGGGALTGRDAWLQVAIIPFSLALAAILIGAASAIAH